MAHKRKSKKSSNYTKLLNDLAKLKNPRVATSYLKEKYSEKEVEKYFSKLSSIMIYKEYMVGTPFPKNYEVIISDKKTYTSSLDKEIWWSILSIKMYSSEINGFIKLSEKYFDLLLYGMYEEANQILNEVEDRYGISSWLIENRIIIYSKLNGMKKQKQYVSEIEGKLSITMSLTSYFYSQKLENELSYEQFNKSFELFWSEHLTIKDYFSLKCNPLVEKIDSPSDVLFDESSNPIIDRYITLKKIFSIIILDEKYYGLSKENLQRHLLSINSSIEDKELIPFYYMTELSECDTLEFNTEEYVKALDLYTCGHYEKANNLCITLLNENINNYFGVIELLINSEIRSSKDNLEKINIPEDSIIYQIYIHSKNIILKNDLMINSVNKLLKLSMELSSYIVASKILLFINNELPFIKQKVSNHSIRIGYQNSFYFDVRRLKLLTNNRKEHLISCYSEKYSNSITYKLICNKTKDLKLDIPKYRLDKYIAKLDDINMLTLDKIDIYNSLIAEGFFLDKYEAIVQVTSLYFELGKLEKCIMTIVDGILLNENLVYSIPIKKITEYVEKEHAFDFDSNICTSILYEIYSKNISSALDIEKGNRYEIFLEEQGLTKPNEIIEKYKEFDTLKIDYFLQYVCITQVLDSSVYFSETKEVEDERILICQFLITKNNSSNIFLAKEIKEITENSLISDSILEIEQNKIYVNTEGIKMKLSSVLNEYYLRYIDLVKNDNNLNKTSQKVILYPDGSLNIMRPKNDITPMLFNALKEVRDYFVFSNEYGLNGYLSTNIRHGALFNFLKSSLISSKVTTRKENEKDEYKDNKYWKEYYNGEDEESINIMIQELSIFSKKIDNIIYKLRDEYIHIKTEEKATKGLFNYSLDENDMIYLYRYLKEDPSYEEFEDAIFDVLWQYTEISLKDIRNVITNEIDIEFQNAFTNLTLELERIKEKINLSYLRDKISLESTNMQRKLDTVKSWLTRRTASDIADFNFSLPISISEKMLNNVHSYMNIKIEKNIENTDIIQGQMLKGFVDILYILFDNAVKHGKNKNVNIKVAFLKSTRKGNKYTINVINSVNENINLELNKQKIDAIKETITNKLFGHKVSSEGGTGFYKIVRILNYDLKYYNAYINFYFNDNNQFIVTIDI